MSVVALRDFQAPQPATKLLTVFCVQSYWRDRTRLVRGKFQQFGNMELALRAGRAASVKAPRVEVYRWRGIAETGYCCERTVVAHYGDNA